MNYTLSFAEYLFNKYPPTITVKQLAEITGENEQTIRNRLSKGTYPLNAIKPFGKVCFLITEVVEMFQKIEAVEVKNIKRVKKGRPTKIEQMAKRRLAVEEVD